MQKSFTQAEEEQSQKPAEAEAQMTKQENAQSPAKPGAPQGISGDVGAEDLRTPYLSLVGKTGQLADEFQPGSFVYNKETVVSDGSKPLDITVLKAHKYWIEDVPYEEDIQPKTFDHLEEATAQGFSKEYGAESRVMPCLRSVCMIPVPEESDAMFSFEGTHYALCLWMLQKTAYTSAAKPVLTAALKGHLRDGIHLAPWELTSTKKSNGKNTWFAPVVKKKPKHSDNLRSFIEEEVLLGFE